MAEAFGQAATQAPQPMQAAASMASVGVLLGHRDRVAVRRAAGGHRDEAAGRDDAVEGAAVDDQVLDHRERRGAPGLDGDASSPSLKLRMWSWQAVVPRPRAVRRRR